MFEFFGAVITALRGRASSLLVGLSLATVSAATGFISYTHISALTQDYWQNWKTAHLMPLAVDGQIVIGSVYFMEHSGEKKRWLGLIGVVPGILESLYSNWESVTLPHGTHWLVGLEAHFWATVPAQAFACSTILFERWLHSRRARGSAKSTATSVIAAAPLAMARIAAELFPQAPEPVAPGPEPEVAACRDTSRALSISVRPEGAPWGLVTPAAAPEPALSQPPAFAIPTLGPVMDLSQRPASRPRAVKAVADAPKLPLPSGEELERVLTTMSRNEIWRTYQVSKHKADQLLKALAEGNLEEVA